MSLFHGGDRMDPFGDRGESIGRLCKSFGLGPCSLYQWDSETVLDFKNSPLYHVYARTTSPPLPKV
jgi:hypothetical protein